jgi:hypothetical protein
MYKIIFAVAAIPLICLGALAVIVGLTLYLIARSRQSTTSFDDTLNKNIGSHSVKNNLNSLAALIEKKPGKPCPACGGENPEDAIVCAYCRRKMK